MFTKGFQRMGATRSSHPIVYYLVERVIDRHRNEDFGTKFERLQLVADMAQHFWKWWAAEVTSIEVVRRRGNKTGRNLCVGDLVLVHEASKVKNKYILARVQTVKMSDDGLV